MTRMVGVCDRGWVPAARRYSKCPPPVISDIAYEPADCGSSAEDSRQRYGTPLRNVLGQGDALRASPGLECGETTESSCQCWP